jgi:hypothetical protein
MCECVGWDKGGVVSFRVWVLPPPLLLLLSCVDVAAARNGAKVAHKGGSDAW